MPVIEVWSPAPSPGRDRLESLSAAVTDELALASGHCWVMWSHQDPDSHFRPEWVRGNTSPPPVALVTCKSVYPVETRGRLVATIARHLADMSGAPMDAVYVALRLVEPGGLWVRGTVWNEEITS